MADEKKKRGFLDYGKAESKDDDRDAETDDESESEDDGEEKKDAGKMRIKHLAEQTGVKNPDALVKLIKACMAAGG